MGLGPPVCLNCKVLGTLTKKAVNGSAWWCPVCHDRDLKGHYFELTSDEIRAMKDNMKFRKFLNGEI